MVDLLGIGMTDGAAGWLLRRICARIGPGALTLVVSRQSSPRRALLDAVAGRRVPQEGRIWVNGVPVSRETIRRLRSQVKELEFSAPLIERRSVLWNTLAVAPRGLRTVRGCFHLPWLGARRAAQNALEIAGLGARAREPVSGLHRRERVRLRVARALAGRPACLLARDVDVRLPAEDAQTVLALLRVAAQDLSLVVLATVENVWLAYRSGDHVVVLDGGPITGA